ncbi:uncharacterized protein LOC115834115 [Nomascus leucogenys]|uniref:uncharacterized protein LOC115834115 n=1 Tax=Nomascus leucogenys TaxID=61853 RepID=UPI00122D630F|nr:uncharacterized protein LOC115834115 [Nomascus leucogenys]
MGFGAALSLPAHSDPLAASGARPLHLSSAFAATAAGAHPTTSLLPSPALFAGGPHSPLRLSFLECQNWNHSIPKMKSMLGFATTVLAQAPVRIRTGSDPRSWVFISKSWEFHFLTSSPGSKSPEARPSTCEKQKPIRINIPYGYSIRLIHIHIPVFPQSLQYCLGTSGNSKLRPHMKKTGKGFVTMENTCRVKASASPKGDDTAGERRRKRRTSFTRSLDHVSMPTDARKKRSMIFPNFGIFCQALFHANKGKKKVTQHPEGRKATSLSPSAEAKQACGPPYASFLLLTF